MLKPTPRVTDSDEDQGASQIALRALFESEEHDLLRYAFYLTGRREVAEEIVQDVFLQLYKRWTDISNPKAWLYRSARNKAFNYARDNRREVLGNHTASDHTESPQASPQIAMEKLETTATLRKLLAELDESDQELVKLKYFEGLKYREISERTGLTVSNVGYRLHHILKDLSGKLRPMGIDETL